MYKHYSVREENEKLKAENAKLKNFTTLLPIFQFRRRSNEDRLRTHNATTMHGKMFVTFLSLIIQTEITNQLYKSSLSKTYSVPELFMELRKIRLFSRSFNKTPFLSEISKKQRTIFSAFNIPVPSISSLLTF